MDINLLAPINSLGYGYTSYHITNALIDNGVNLSLFPIGGVEKNLDIEKVNKALTNSVYFNKLAPCIRIWHQFDMSQFVGKGPHIGFPIFELDEFNPREIHHLNSCDYLFVCSEWARQVCINNGMNSNNIFVVPLGVDTSVFTPKLNVGGPTIFVNIGKWEVRKGHDILAEAFKSAFSDTDNVMLLMCCNNPFLNSEEVSVWTKKYNNPKIRLIPRLPSQAEVAKLIQSADCGIFPSRAEGWNLEALETLACGKQLIITDYSAHQQFCNKQNAYLVNIDELEIARDNKWFISDIGKWAKIGESQINQLINHMRSVHLAKTSGALQLNYGGIETANKLSWNNTAHTIMEHINGIAKP